MRDLIIKMLILIGGFMVGIILAYIIDILHIKIKTWRNNNCKIKCFCKPHIWELEWLWYNSGEACLKCQKCGKQKKLIISVDSFEKMLGIKKGNFRLGEVEDKNETG